MKNKESEIKEYKGWKLEEVVWFNVWSEKRPHHGEIKIFHPDDKISPCVSIYDLTNDIWRVVPIKFIFSTRKEAREARKDHMTFLENLRYGT